jgi:hypothetical protein
LGIERTVPTEEVLDIVWLENGGGNTRKGVLAYALFTDPDRESPAFPVGVWPAGTRFDSTRINDRDDKSYAAIYWTILPGSWPAPDRWCETLESTLKALSDGDAVVAWCALEPGWALPPTLFDPDQMLDDIYAAMIPGRFVCSAQLGKLYEPLPRAVMIEFMNATNERFAAQLRERDN